MRGLQDEFEGFEEWTSSESVRQDVERSITTTIDHDATNDDDLALRQRILDRILDTIDDASNAPTQYVQMCLAA